MTDILSAQVPTPATEREFTVKARSRRATITRRFVRNRTALIGSIALILLVLFATLGQLFWTAGTNPDYAQFLPPSGSHPFGTDQLGRDMMALIIKGIQFSLLIAVVVAIMVVVIGVALGAVAGYLGGWQGMGYILVQNVNRKEPYMILAFLMVTGVFIILFNLLADIAYTLLDPRVRLD